MSRLAKPGRREFLIGSISGAAGLALGIYKVWKWKESQNEPAGTFSPSAWIQITPDNVVRVQISKSEMGQGVRTSLAMLVAEELEAEWSTIRVEQAETDTKFGEQRTQGSSSVRTMWIPLSQAGATAREMLVAAAARRWGVEGESCRAVNGSVIHAPSGRHASYGELAASAAALAMPKEIALKKPSEYKLLGKPLKRLDSPSKVCGSAVFGIDVRVPGMLYAAVLRCPYIGGRLKKFDAGKAKAVPGVRAVLETSGGVAAVADSTWSAFAGKAAIEAEWDAGPHASLSEESIQNILEQSGKGKGATARNDGDVEKALASAHKIVESDFRVPYLAHAALEPLNCTASAHWNRCEIWCSTQNPRAIQRRAARIALLPPSWVEVHTTLIGGGFGRRLETDMVADAVELSKATGKPIQVVWTREDDMRHDVYRPAAYSQMVAGLDADGNLSAWKHRLVTQSVDSDSGSSQQPQWTSVQGGSDIPYSIPNVYVDCVVPSLPVPVGYWRSVGYSLNAFFTECFMDEVAEAAGKDPYEFRLGLLRNSPRVKAVLELAAEKSNWKDPMPAGKGRGLALHTSYRTTVAQVAEVSRTADGSFRVERVVCALDCGRIVNPDTIRAQTQGGIVFGLSAAFWGNITFGNGRVLESNYDSYRVLRIAEMPEVEVYIIESEENPTGVGEVAVPPIAPAVANAMYKVSGKRIRRLPIMGLDANLNSSS
jgi:isoquinoline 1-oxidoreductase subunit beta